MSNPPAIGQDPWGTDLNAYLATLEDRLVAVEARPEYAFSSAPWQFSNQAPPATGNQVRLNNVSPAGATLIDFRKIDSDGADRSPWLQGLVADSFIRLQDWDNAGNFYRYRVTGTPVTDATNIQVPVVWITGAGSIPNAKANVGFLVVLVL